MQTQIPKHSNQGSIQGATIQKTWPPFSGAYQPEVAYMRWSWSPWEDGQANRFIVAARPEIHQGATKQQTHPVFKTNQAEFAYMRYSFSPWEDLRAPQYFPAAPPQLHQGAANMSTDPVPPVTSRPELRYFLPDARDVNRILAGAGPVDQVEGATKQGWFIFPTNQPEQIGFFRALIRNIFNTGSAKWIDRITSVAGSQGPNSPSTVGDDSSIGSAPWLNTSNVLSNNGVYTTSAVDAPMKDDVVQLIKDDGGSGTLTGNNKADGTNWVTTDPGTYYQYGSQSDLWGATWTPADINAAGFGLALAVLGGSAISHYLKVQNFGFSIPANATVVGILAEIKRYDKVGGVDTASVDHIRITVYYTTPGDTGLQTNSFQPINQPEQARFSLLNALRFIVGATPRNEGATTLQNDGTPVISVPATLWYTKREANVSRPLEHQPPVPILDNFTPPVSSPELSYWFRKDPNRIHAGAGPTAQKEGPTIQDWFIYPVNQPRREFTERRRYLEDWFIPMIKTIVSRFSEKYSKQNTSYSDKFSSRGTSYGEKYTKQGTAYGEKYQFGSQYENKYN